MRNNTHNSQIATLIQELAWVFTGFFARPSGGVLAFMRKV